MFLHYLVKYGSHKIGDNLEYVSNDKWQGSSLVGMDYFVTNISFNLIVKECLKSVNIWQSYRQNG